MSSNKIEESIHNYFTTQENFNGKRKAILNSIRQDDQNVISESFTILFQIFSNKNKYHPMAYLNALRLLKESMDLKNIKIVTETQNKLLTILGEMAKFKANLKDDDRGANFFSNKPTNDEKIIGNSFLRLLLECLLHWAKWFPLDQSNKPTKFKQIYDSLVNLGVKFPSDINFFKQKPKKLLNERLNTIFERLETQKDFLVNILSVTYEKELDLESTETIMSEFKNLMGEYPKLMEDLLGENSDKNEEWLARILVEQEVLQKVLNSYEKFKKKEIFFAPFKKQIFELLQDPHQTPNPQIGPILGNEEHVEKHVFDKRFEMQNNFDNSKKPEHQENVEKPDKQISNVDNQQESHQRNLDDLSLSEIKENSEDYKGSPKAIDMNLFDVENNKNSDEIRSFEKKSNINESKIINKTSLIRDENKPNEKGPIFDKNEGSSFSKKNPFNSDYKPSKISFVPDDFVAVITNEANSYKKDIVPNKSILKNQKNSNLNQNSDEELISKLKNELQSERNEKERLRIRINELQSLFEEKENIIETLLHEKRGLNKDLEEKEEEFNSVISQLKISEKNLDQLKHQLKQKDDMIINLKEFKKKSEFELDQARFSSKKNKYGINFEEEMLKKKNEEKKEVEPKLTKILKLSQYMNKKDSILNDSSLDIKNEAENLKNKDFRDKDNNNANDAKSNLNLLYPFENTENYWEKSMYKKSFPKKNFSSVFKLFADINKLDDKMILDFKFACLKNKSMLFDNNFIEIGVISQPIMFHEKEMIKFSIFIGNKTDYVMDDFQLDVKFGTDLAIYSTNPFFYLDRKSQLKQDFIIEIIELPYLLHSSSINFKIFTQLNHLPILIPLCPLKILHPHPINPHQFRSVFSQKSTKIYLESGEMQLNNLMCKNVEDLKLYFPNFCKLSENKIGCFYTFQKDNIWVKIRWNDKKKISFGLVSDEGKIGEFFMDWIGWIFGNSTDAYDLVIDNF